LHSRFSYGSGSIPYDPNQSDRDEKPLARNLRGIVKRKWIVLAVFFFVLALAVAYAYTRVPVYRSTAVLRVSTSLPSSGNAGFADYFTNFTLYYETVVQGLKTGVMSGRSPGGPGGFPLTLQDGNVNVNPDKGTPFITLTMNAREPLLAKQRLQRYLEEFMQSHRVGVEDAMGILLSTMEKDLREFQEQMIKSQTELREFSIKHGLVLSGSDPYMSSFVDKAAENLIQIRGRRLDLEITASQRKGLLPRRIGDDYLDKLKKDCAAMQTEYMAMGITYTPDYVNMRVLKSKIDTFQKAISDIEGNELTASLSELRKQELSAKQVYEKTKQDLMEKSPVAMQFSILKKEADADANMYLALKDKLWHAKFYSNMMANSLDVYSPPTLPIAPVYPNKLKIIGLGALLGLVGGIAVAFGLDRADKTSGHIDSIRKHLGVPILGVVPLTAPDPKPSDDVRKFLAHHFPVSPFADALSLVHFSASQLTNTRSGTAICITSSLPGEGKTLISLALAKIVASENKRVLVIDGDMRKHTASDLYGCEAGAPGLSDFLSGKCPDIHEAVRESRVAGIHFMRSGPSPENPVALLKSRAMRECVAECKKNFDLVIIDSPPVLGMLDASILGGNSNGVILVVKHGATSVEFVRRAARSLLQANAQILGIVVNMAKETDGSHNAYYSNYYRGADHRASGADGQGATVS
jgi:polysaccharide biosynthesis transport protein